MRLKSFDNKKALRIEGYPSHAPIILRLPRSSFPQAQHDPVSLLKALIITLLTYNVRAAARKRGKL